MSFKLFNGVVSILLLAFSAFFATIKGENYALLISGSNHYWNYRHQADICHAYHVLLQAGMKAENIVVMTYDDAPFHPKNPFPGQLFNTPDGDDVNKGCVKDYTAKDVNKANFIHILKGEENAVKGIGSGRVLHTTAKDNIFLNFVDHGSPGILQFPSEEIMADELIAVLEILHKQQRYSKMLIYVEACHSGSMFERLPDDWNIYVNTAAKGSEVSYAAYCPPLHAFRGDDDIQACLGDVFQLGWMTAIENLHGGQESMSIEFDQVKKVTDESTVSEFGTLGIKEMETSFFFGPGVILPKVVPTLFTSLFASKYVQIPQNETIEAEVPQHTLSSRDAKLAHHIRAVMSDYSNQGELDSLYEELQHRRTISKIFDQIQGEFQLSEGVHDMSGVDFDCYRALVASLRKNCLEGEPLSDIALKYTGILANACSFAVDRVRIESIFESECFIF